MRQVRDVLQSMSVGDKVTIATIGDAVGYDKDDRVSLGGIKGAMSAHAEFGFLVKLDEREENRLREITGGGAPMVVYMIAKPVVKFRKEVQHVEPFIQQYRRDRYGGSMLSEPPPKPKPKVEPPKPDRPSDQPPPQTLTGRMAETVRQTMLDIQQGAVTVILTEMKRMVDASEKANVGQFATAFDLLTEQIGELKAEVKALGEMLARREPIQVQPVETVKYEAGENHSGPSLQQIWSKYKKPSDFVKLLEKAGCKFLKQKHSTALYGIGRATVSVPNIGFGEVDLENVRTAYRTLKGEMDIDLKKFA